MLEANEAQWQSAREHVEVLDEIRVTLPKTQVPQGKVMVHLTQLSFCYSKAPDSLIQNFNLSLRGPCRIALTGGNGNGKTTLVKLMLRELQPQNGTVYRGQIAFVIWIRP